MTTTVNECDLLRESLKELKRVLEERRNEFISLDLTEYTETEIKQKQMSIKHLSKNISDLEMNIFMKKFLSPVEEKHIDRNIVIVAANSLILSSDDVHYRIGKVVEKSANLRISINEILKNCGTLSEEEQNELLRSYNVQWQKFFNKSEECRAFVDRPEKMSQVGVDVKFNQCIFELERAYGDFQQVASQTEGILKKRCKERGTTVVQPAPSQPKERGPDVGQPTSPEMALVRPVQASSVDGNIRNIVYSWAGTLGSSLGSFTGSLLLEIGKKTIPEIPKIACLTGINAFQSIQATQAYLSLYWNSDSENMNPLPLPSSSVRAEEVDEEERNENPVNSMLLAAAIDSNEEVGRNYGAHNKDVDELVKAVENLQLTEKASDGDTKKKRRTEVELLTEHQAQLIAEGATRARQQPSRFSSSQR